MLISKLKNLEGEEEGSKIRRKGKEEKKKGMKEKQTDFNLWSQGPLRNKTAITNP